MILFVSKKFYNFASYIVYDPVRVTFYMWCKAKIRIKVFLHIAIIFLTSFVENIILFPLNYPEIFVKNQMMPWLA